MKKTLSILLAALLVFGLAACSGNTNTPAESPPVSEPAATTTPDADASQPAVGPVAEEVKGVTIPAFSVLVNGVTITQTEMAVYPMYSVQAVSVNSAGTESTTTYIGFMIKDLLEAAGLKDSYIWLEATADDGYAITFTGGVIYEDTTLLAMTRDGSPFSGAPWFAPCSDGTTGNYLKNAVSILVNTVEGAPDIEVPDTQGGSAGANTGELPEILDRTDKVEFAPYSFKVNGNDITNDTLEGLSIYKISATAVNSKGDSIVSDYTGYRLSAVLEACGITEYTTVKAVANDGYETELTAELVESEYTLVAIEKDKETGEDGTVWIAPCTETETKSYCKLVVDIVAE